MKSITVIKAICFFVLFACKCSLSISQTIVKGQIVPGKSYSLELWVYDINQDKYQLDRKLDLTANGKFHFEIPESPNLYKLWLNGKGLVFINDGDTNIDIQIDLNNEASPFKITGSTASNHLIQYFHKVEELQKKYLFPLEPKLKAALKSNDQSLIEAVEKEHQENLVIFAQTLYQEISNMGSSLAVFAIIRTLDFNKYLKYIEVMEKQFSKGRPHSSFNTKIQEWIKDAKRLAIGANAPEIILSITKDNQLQKLSSLKGKLTLVDFWASWCLPCRKENRELKPLYEQYHAKGFEIWSISTDEKRAAWERALQKDGLTWLNSLVTDKKIEETYQVLSLPTNFLIDAQGRIIAKNIKAKDLEEYLKKL